MEANRIRALIALMALTLNACAYDTRFEDCTVQCTTDMECPEDLACGTEGLCRTPGATETCSMVLETSPSCIGLAKTCGPNADEDCCSTAEPIPGGTFFRSYDVAGDGMYPSTSYPATVSPFVLDRFEVTVGRFRQFIEANRGTQANPPPAGAGARRLNGADGQGGWEESWNTNLTTDVTALVAAVKCNSYASWTDLPGTNETLPINCVTWYEAFAFCTWDGGFLSSEAEWNFAAAGGSEQRTYPWSLPPATATVDCSFANYSADCVNPPNGAVNRVGRESPKGDGKWKQADFGGNVWEWTLDSYQSTYINPCDDCAELEDAALRVFRGGSFFGGSLRTGERGGFSATRRVGNVGVRCVRAP